MADALVAVMILSFVGWAGVQSLTSARQRDHRAEASIRLADCAEGLLATALVGGLEPGCDGIRVDVRRSPPAEPGQNVRVELVRGETSAEFETVRDAH